MALQKKTVSVALAIAAIMMVAVVMAITSTRTVPTTGTITGVNLGVFSDLACNNPIDSTNKLSWGALNPGDNVPVTVYLKNSGSAPMTLSLQVDAASWNPAEAGTHLTIDWNKEGLVLPASTSGFAAILTLHAPSNWKPDLDTTFSVNVVIAGTHT